MKATDHLLNDHRLVRKLLEGFSIENPRFPEILKTLQRAIVGHAWFEDTIFFPAFEREPLLEKRFMQEMFQEHLDLDHFLKLLRRTPDLRSKEFESYVLQTRVLLDTHFRKEEDALFPLAERILDSEDLNRLGDEMELRKTDIRAVIEPLDA
jgi:hemerythrin-like domain-containing protein